MTEATKPQPEKSPALLAWIARHDRLAAIDIVKTLEALEALPNQDRQRDKWKIPGVGNIIVKKQGWLNGNLHLSGGGSISLVKHALGMDSDNDKEAMKWLAEKFPEEMVGEWIPPAAEEDEERSFAPPERVDEGLDDVREYLINQRGLPASLIEREISAGRLYATQQRDKYSGKIYGETQCVFIGPSSAEIRSTDPAGFKGCCPGSDSERSCYQVMFRGAHSTKVVITEAAVDALSHHAMDPSSFVLSTNGAGRFDLQYKITLEAHRNGFSTVWALDADQPGDIAAQRLFNALLLRDKLSKEWDVSPEQIDDWIIQNKIISVPDDSPHQFFLDDPQLTDRPVHLSQKDPNSVKVQNIQVDTGKTAPATVSYKVHKAAGSIKKGAQGSFTLSPQDIEDVLATYRVSRSRPKHAKDWNEEWKGLGHNGVAHYEETFSPKVQAQPTPAASQSEPKQRRFARTAILADATPAAPMAFATRRPLR